MLSPMPCVVVKFSSKTLQQIRKLRSSNQRSVRVLYESTNFKKEQVTKQALTICSERHQDACRDEN